ncbi:MAG: 6-bladed beta-propeller [Magnetococcus sp. YQC-5]
MNINQWGRSVYLGMMLLFLFGCATTQEEPELSTGEMYWPKPPEMPRYTWESVIHTAKDVERKNKEDLDAFNVIASVDDKQVFVKPVRIAAQGGRIFVTDTMARRIHVFDAVRRRFYQMGFRREGVVDKPLGIALDKKGMVYVADSKRKTVIVYDQLGMFIKWIGDDKILNNPVAVSVSADGSRIYVIDNGAAASSKHQMLIFNSDGQLVGSPIGQRGNEDGAFNFPTDICVGPDGRVYVLDAGNFRVQVFDRDGQFLYKWGRVGHGLGQLARPRAIAVDKDNLVYVLDGSFANLQIFDDKGQLLLPIGERSLKDGPGIFSSPSGVATDDTGRVYIVDQWLKKVEILRKLSPEEGKNILDGKKIPASPVNKKKE